MIRRLANWMSIGSARKTDPSPGASKTANGSVLQSAPEAKFQVGQVVKHRLFPFRGVIFDVDPEFNNTEEWYEAIPEEVRPRKDQPYYHLFAENERTHYVAYVSEQNLEPDDSSAPVSHPDIAQMFEPGQAGQYRLKAPIHN